MVPQVLGLEIGTLAGWVTAISTSTGMVTLVGLFLRFRLGSKRLDQEDAEKLRIHTNEELDRMQGVIDGLRGEVAKTRRDSAEAEQRAIDRWRKCEEESARQRVEIEGLKRQISQYSADQLILLEKRGCPSDAAPRAVESAQRVKKIGDGK